MLTPEARSGPSFQPEIKYSNPSLAPALVAQNTSEYMGRVLRDRGDAPFEREYLRDTTLTFLQMAKNGLVANFPIIREIGKIDVEALQYMVDAGFDFGNSAEPQDTEAFGHSIITMGLLPSMATHPQLPQGFSRSGVLATPSTIAQYNERMREIKTTTIGLATGNIPRGVNILNNPALCRTYYFFDVAGRIPLRNDDDKKTLNKMLEGIEIEL